MAQNYVYPSSSQVTVSGIGTANNAPIPAQSVLIAGENPSGNQQVVQTDSAGNLIVAPLASSSTVTVVQPTGTNLHAVIDASALPTGASTASLQTTGNSVLGSILLDLTNGTQITQVSNFPATQPVSGSVTVTQATGTNLHAVIDSGTVTLSGTSPVSGTVTVTQATGTNLHTVVDSSALPTGGSTAANQATEIASLATIASFSASQATSANQLTGNTSLSSILTNQTNGTQKVLSSPVTPTALTITQAAVTVGTTAVRLTPTGSAPSSTRVLIAATPDGASTAKFYIGSSSVTSTGATRGIQIVAGQTFIANNDAGDYFIVSDTASQTVEIMAQG